MSVKEVDEAEDLIDDTQEYRGEVEEDAGKVKEQKPPPPYRNKKQR